MTNRLLCMQLRDVIYSLLKVGGGNKQVRTQGVCGRRCRVMQEKDTRAYAAADTPEPQLIPSQHHYHQPTSTQLPSYPSTPSAPAPAPAAPAPKCQAPQQPHQAPPYINTPPPHHHRPHTQIAYPPVVQSAAGVHPAAAPLHDRHSAPCGPE